MAANAVAADLDEINSAGPGTQVCFRVVAFESTGTVPVGTSAAVCATTPPAAPAAPKAVAAKAISLKQMDITWEDASTNELGFTIYRTTLVGQVESKIKLGDVKANVVKYTDTTVNTTAEVCYLVEAFNLGDKTSSAAGGSACDSTIKFPQPAPVIGVSGRARAPRSDCKEEGVAGLIALQINARQTCTLTPPPHTHTKPTPNPHQTHTNQNKTTTTPQNTDYQNGSGHHTGRQEGQRHCPLDQRINSLYR